MACLLAFTRPLRHGELALDAADLRPVSSALWAVNRERDVAKITQWIAGIYASITKKAALPETPAVSQASPRAAFDDSLFQLAQAPGGADIARLISVRTDQLLGSPYSLVESFDQRGRDLEQISAFTGLPMIAPHGPATVDGVGNSRSYSLLNLDEAPELLLGFQKALLMNAESCARLALDPARLTALAGAARPCSESQTLARLFGRGFSKALLMSLRSAQGSDLAAGERIIESLTREARNLADDPKAVAFQLMIPRLFPDIASAVEMRQDAALDLGAPSWALDMGKAPPSAWLQKCANLRWLSGPQEQWGSQGKKRFAEWKEVYQAEKKRIDEAKHNALYADDRIAARGEVEEASRREINLIAAGLCLDCGARAQLKPGDPFKSLAPEADLTRLFDIAAYPHNVDEVAIARSGPVADLLRDQGLGALTGWRGAPADLSASFGTALAARARGREPESLEHTRLARSSSSLEP